MKKRGKKGGEGWSWATHQVARIPHWIYRLLGFAAFVTGIIVLINASKEKKVGEGLAALGVGAILGGFLLGVGIRIANVCYPEDEGLWPPDTCPGVAPRTDRDGPSGGGRRKSKNKFSYAGLLLILVCILGLSNIYGQFNNGQLV